MISNAKAMLQYKDNCSQYPELLKLYFDAEGKEKWRSQETQINYPTQNTNDLSGGL